MIPSTQTEFRVKFKILATIALCVGPVLAADSHPVTGRVYAGVMSPAGATWLERSTRENEEHPRLAVKLLELKPGMVVADVGAGSGYYTELIARVVGPDGKVFATDVQSEMVRLLERKIAERRLLNVQAIRGGDAQSNLPDGCCDLVLLVDVYHEFSKPQEMLRSLRAALKSGGRLVLLEFRKEDPSIPIHRDHKMSIAEVRAELEPEGFAFDKVLNDLPWQHMLFFRK